MALTGYTRTEHRFHTVEVNGLRKIVLRHTPVLVAFPDAPVPLRTAPDAPPAFVPPTLPPNTNLYSGKLVPTAKRAPDEPSVEYSRVEGLIRRRMDLGLTQGQLAKAIGYSRGALSLVELGRRALTLKLALRIDLFLVGLETLTPEERAARGVQRPAGNCRYCGTTLPFKVTGEAGARRLYCTSSCKQQFYFGRRAEQETPRQNP